MIPSVKSRAEREFAAAQKKDKQALKEKEKAQQEKADKIANLRALRLAKEAADLEAAKKKSPAKKKATKTVAAKTVTAKITAAEKTPAESKGTTRSPQSDPSQFPQVH